MRSLQVEDPADWLDGLVWCRPQNEDLLLVCKPIKDAMILSLHASEVADTSVRFVEVQLHPKLQQKIVF